MRSDPAVAKLDFSRRADLSEWMDEPSSYEDFRACLRDLAAVNRVTFAYHPTLVWLERLLARVTERGVLRADRPLHIVDVGSGQGDMLRRIKRWAGARKLEVRLTGIDLNPYAARAAREQTSREDRIAWLTSDAFSYAPAEGIDVVISSLFTHHLADAEIVRFLGWMHGLARRGWFVNDLHRGRAPYMAFKLLAQVKGWHRFVQHDGPVSIRRGFAVADWQRYLADAGIEESMVRIETFRPARLCVGCLRG